MRLRNRHVAEHAEPEHDNSERWLLTYSDMITLLLALFIVLFAISSINEKKFLALALGLRQAFDPKPGLLPSSNGLAQNASLTPTAGPEQATGKPTFSPIVPESTTTTAPATTTTSGGQPAEQPLVTIEHQIDEALAAKGLQGTATTTITQRGLVVQMLADQVFFATDSADIEARGAEVVDTIASVLRTDANDVVVEGYTDNQPILGGPYTSNMELSAVRAVNVVLHLTRVDGIAESRLAAIGYGESRPQVPNDTPAHMAQNRRIDVVVLPPGQDRP